MSTAMFSLNINYFFIIIIIENMSNTFLINVKNISEMINFVDYDSKVNTNVHLATIATAII